MMADVSRASDERNLFKAKLEQAELELREKNQARSELIDKLRKLRGDRAQKISSLKVLKGENIHFRVMLDEKKKERESLQKALGRLGGKGENGLCSSEEELNYWLKRLEHRIQHESIPLTEEKQIMREMKKLEATRPRVVANAAARAKIKESMGERDVIESKLKLLKVDMDGIHEHHQVVLATRKQLEEEKRVIEKKIKAVEVELDALTEEKHKTHQSILELRKQLGLRFPQWNNYKSSSRQVKPILVAVNNEKPILAVQRPVTEAVSPKDGVAAAVVEMEKKEANKDKKGSAVAKSVDEPDFYVPEKKHDAEVNEVVVDEVKLKETRREQEIAKAKQALERKKKQAEKAAAKAAVRAQKEADKKQKALEEKEKKKAAADEPKKTETEAESGKSAADDEPKETEAEEAESKNEDRKPHYPMLKRGVRPRGPDLLAKILRKRKKEANYWKRVYGAGAAITGLLAAVGYYFLN